MELFPLPKIKKWIIAFFAVLIIAILAMDCFFTVSEQSNSVVLTFGRVTEVKTAGLHFKIPFIQSIKTIDMTTRGMELGYKTRDDSISANSDESTMITYDSNFVSVDFYVEWRVIDPVKALFNVEEPETLLRNIVQSSARDVVSSFNVDDVLTDKKSEIQGGIKELVNSVLDKYDIGMLVTNVSIQDAEPPNEDVKVAFKSVEDAKQQKDTMLNKANEYSNEIIPRARAEADKIVKSAEAVKEARINEATGQVSRFNEMFSEYINNPAVTKSRMYYEMLEEVLPSLKVYIDSGDNMVKLLDLNK